MNYGDIAQLVARLLRMQKVRGSNPLISTKKSRSSERDFFIQADRLGISSRFSVYIINTALPCCISSHLGVYIKKLSA